jgi:hypothetical protein
LLLTVARCANGGGGVGLGQAGWGMQAAGWQMRLLGVNGSSRDSAIYLIDCDVPSPQDSWDMCAINVARSLWFLLFSVTVPVNAPLVSPAGGPTLACYDGWPIVTLTRQASMTITSHLSTFCDNMSEQRRKKNINCILRIIWEYSKRYSGTGLLMHRPPSTLYSPNTLGDSSNASLVWGLVIHTS